MSQQASSTENTYTMSASSSPSRNTEASSQSLSNAMSSSLTMPKVRLPPPIGDHPDNSMPSSVASGLDAEPDEQSTEETTEADSYETASEHEFHDTAPISMPERPDPAIYNFKPWHPISQDLKKFEPLLLGPSATVLVGPEQKNYTVPMALIFHFSDYAVKALTGSFSEAARNIISLPDTDPRAFTMLVMYMQQGQLRIRESCRKVYPAWLNDRYEGLTDTCLLLCRFYIMMDFLQSRYWPWIQIDVLRQLESVMDEARKMDVSSPILPDTYLEVMRAVNPESRLALLIRLDLQIEFAKPVHRPTTEYLQCAIEFPQEFLTMFEKVVDGLQWGYYKIGMGDPDAGTFE